MKTFVSRTLPLCAIILMVVLYGRLDSLLVKNDKDGLDKQGTALYQIDPKGANLSDINRAVEEEWAKLPKEANSNTASGAAVKNDQAPAQPAKEPVKDAKPAPPPANTNSTAGNTNVVPATGNSTKPSSTNTADKKPLTEKEKAEQDIRGKAAARYSFRLYWTFLSGILLFLSIAAFPLAWYIVSAINEDNREARDAWLLFAYGLAAVVVIGLTGSQDHYVAIIMPMFRETFVKDAVDPGWIHFFNIAGFAATACLVATSAALYWKVREAKESDSPPESYDSARLHAKTILYIGAAMLFVSMLRMSLSFEWHLNYVPEYLKAALSSFFSSILAVQAAFYTILLAIVYLPFASLPKKGDAAKEKAGEQPAGGKIFALLPEPLPKLLAIISPFLAGPIAALVKLFTGG